MKKQLFVLILLLCFLVIGSIKGQENQMKIIKDEQGNISAKFFFSIFGNDTLNNGPFIEYYQNGKMKDSCYFERGIRIGIETFYDNKGRITFVHEYVGNTFPREIRTKAFYYSGACRYCEGRMLETTPGNAINHGVVKYYWKNMQLMDSVIYEKNKEVFRARFDKNGVIQFENRY